MNGAAARFLRLGASLSGLVLLAWILTGQAAKPVRHRVSLPTDWSHRHVIFSQPQTPEEYARLADEPRYLQQLYRREFPAAAAALAPTTFKPTMHRDWAIDLGPGANIGPGNYPAKFGFDVTNASCSDFAVFGTGILSNSGQAAIVGFTNLYSGCGSPTINWAYDTLGRVTTSPVLSLDGTQIAFVQDGGVSSPASLVLIKWQASTTETVTHPKTLSSTSAGNYATCASPPCMIAIPLVDGSFGFGDTTSSVFYDYKNDIAWVGDFAGYLHKFTPVFNGAPAEVTTSPWPIQLNTVNPNPLSSPAFDRISGNVFVGDEGGILYSVNASSGTVTASGQIDFSATGVDTPIIDVTKGLLYVFTSSDGTSSCTGGPCAAVRQLSTTFGSGATGTETKVGNSGSTPNVLYIGAFDTAYYHSPNRTGTLYVCGNTGGRPTLYQIPVNAGAMPTTGKALTMLTLSSAAQCSPVTDIPNPTGGAGGVPAERIFVSVQGDGLSTPCSSAGCVFSFISAEWQASTPYVAGQQILDRNGGVETVTIGGKSGTSAPTWGTSGLPATDNTVSWVSQGLLSASPLGVWHASTVYGVGGARILDRNGNVEVATTLGTSGTTEPTWPNAAGGTVSDGSPPITWTNVGPNPSFALKVSGGTSGIIEDNVVSQTNQAGASQVYFTTLTDQSCTGGTGGCAVQASQPALK